MTENRRLLATLLSNLPGLAYRCRNDEYWTMDFVSDGATALTGYRPDELVGNNVLSYSDLIHPEDRQEVWEQVQAALQEKRRYAMRYRIMTKAGEERAVWEQGMGVFGAEGALLSLEGFIMDVTESRKAEEMLKRYAEEVERSNRELDQFASSASHDLQEPLRTITRFLQLLKTRYQGIIDRDADEFIGFAVDGARRMHDLVDSLLDYSRITIRAKPLARIDCQELLPRVLSDISGLMEETAARVTSGPLPVVMADEDQLVRVWQNLIGNAIKFRKTDEPPHIQITAEKTANISAPAGGSDRAKEGYLFSVQDNGIGIASQYHERIFELFQRLHTRTEYPGTGLGLAICRKIIERHGGRLWVESHEGEGATFHFTLPAPEEA
ncbi:MAG: ATP-binding protein [Smithellaceae bacterium]|nr:ATP-binding protein [Smithellaceae bacterium]